MPTPGNTYLRGLSVMMDLTAFQKIVGSDFSLQFQQDGVFQKNNSSLDFINNLKLRLSKGLIGNDRVNPYQFSETYSIVTGAGPIIGDQAVPQVGYGVYPNFNITWEKQDNTNIGLEWGLFSSKYQRYPME